MVPLSEKSKLLSMVDDNELFHETARRLKEKVQSHFTGEFSYGEVTFVYHAGHFVRIDCKPSMRAYLSPKAPSSPKRGASGE